MKDKIVEILKYAYLWGRDNGEGRSEKNFNDFLETSTFKEFSSFYSAGEEVSDDDITIALENFKTEKGYPDHHVDYMNQSDIFEDGFMTAIEWLKKLTRPTVSEEEIDEVIHAVYNIYVLQERITFYYANRPTLVDEISKLQTRQRKAIKKLLNR